MPSHFNALRVYHFSAFHFTCKQTCRFVVFIVASYHTQIQMFSFITCLFSQFCAQICSYYSVLPGAVFCCSNKNYNVYNIVNMTLHAGLVNPTCLESFRVRYCSGCELHCLNPNKKGRVLVPMEDTHFLF